MIALWALTLFTASIVLLFAVGVCVFLRRLPVLRPANALENGPLVSVIVPARNEAEHIERCVRSLLAQNYSNLEVIAVDDASSDATPQILDRLLAENPNRLNVVSGRPLPQGWTGKNNAVYSGVLQARGTWLLFVDADVTLHHGAVSAAYRAATTHRVTMVTLWAQQQLVTFWERVVQPVVIGINMSTDALVRVNDLRYPNHAFANGQFIFVERAAYEQVGGHAHVRDEVVEDQKLSWEFKRAQLPILMMNGTAVLSTRMYHSLSSIWEGWSKNNFLMLGRSFVLVFLSLLAIYTLSISPFLLTIWALIAFKFSHSLFDPLFVNLASCALILGIRWHSRSFFPSTFGDFLLHPLGGLVYMGVVINSAYCHSQRRGVTWKGRRYGDADALG